MHSQDRARTRLLFVSGNPFVAGLARTMLRDTGFSAFREASSVALAHEMLRREPFDAVICDWHMVDGSCIDLLRRLRDGTMGRVAMIPVIVMHGGASRREVVATARAGANDVLVKPFSQNALERKVLTALIEKRALIRTPAYTGPAPREALIAYLTNRLRRQIPRREREDVEFIAQQANDAVLL